MKRKELTKTLMMISNLKKHWYPWFIQKYFSIVRVMMSHVFWQKFCSEKQGYFICLFEIHSQASHTFKTKSNFIINSLSYIILQYVWHCVRLSYTRLCVRVYVIRIRIRHPYYIYLPLQYCSAKPKGSICLLYK